MDKANGKRLAWIAGGAAVLFFAVPFLLSRLPEQVYSIGMLVMMFLVNQIYMAVVGWHANNMGKIGVYVPLAAVALYLVSELVLYGGIGWAMEINYLEAGYIVYFLRKLLLRRQKQQEQKDRTSFPKGMGRK
ncbi:MAG: hypothetical protein Q4C65_08335 [Eubacteriales bacterium]|nr:hypothetical protein [Eubacteriales bacterium]